MSDDTKALAQFAVRQAQLIGMVSLQLGDQAVAIYGLLPKCSKCGSAPQTIEHRHLKIRLCDRCAAESIVAAGRAYVDGYLDNPDDPLNDARSSLLDENDWLDLPDAPRIRRVAEFVEVLREGDVAPERTH